ncbi:hypothetical protein GCM10027160_23580 [Streptomyces calidiresistens]|uniref:DUF4352 domain-containing protein n=1 Tax=Streptomyces calidiresistens TaxID=1485586 RepID=A0A7W3T5F5_9ACTN|nr:hypothetical protein [Streptomyces calidiresistens]MBB0231280.1 hypothetical protein [Streptomyces calidiresistens]
MRTTSIHTPHAPARVRRGRALAAGTAALILALAACGSGDNGDGDDGADGGSSGGAGGQDPTAPPTTGGASDGGTGDTGSSEGDTAGDDGSGGTEGTAGGAAVADLGATHTITPSQGLTLAIAVDLDRLVVPNDEVDGGFGADGDEEYALLTITATNPGDQPITLDAVYQECTVDGQVTEYELWEGITTEWPNLVPAGGEVTWAPTCALDGGQELTYSIAVNDSDTVWWTGTIR